MILPGRGLGSSRQERQLRSRIFVASTFQNYSLAVELCTVEYHGPLKELKNYWDDHSIEELAMQQLESILVDILKTVTVVDVTKGGPSKTRLASFLAAVCGQPRARTSDAWREDVLHLERLVNCDRYAVEQLTTSLDLLRDPEEGTLRDLAGKPVLQMFISLPIGPKILDLASTSAHGRSGEAQTDSNLNNIMTYVATRPADFSPEKAQVGEIGWVEDAVAVLRSFNKARAVGRKSTMQAKCLEKLAAQLDEHLVTTFENYARAHVKNGFQIISNTDPEKVVCVSTFVKETLELINKGLALKSKFEALVTKDLACCHEFLHKREGSWASSMNVAMNLLFNDKDVVDRRSEMSFAKLTIAADFFNNQSSFYTQVVRSDEFMAAFVKVCQRQR